jgi:hypothetical protein
MTRMYSGGIPHTVRAIPVAAPAKALPEHKWLPEAGRVAVAFPWTARYPVLPWRVGEALHAWLAKIRLTLPPIHEEGLDNDEDEKMHISLSFNQASDLIKRIEATRDAKGSLFEVVMPNSKRMGDCYKDELVQISKALRRLGFETESEGFNRLAFAMWVREQPEVQPN